MATPYRQRSAAACMLLIAASTVIGGCSVSANKKVAVSQAAPTSMDATAEARAEALAAYKGMIADWTDATAVGDYHDPVLAHHASGAALTVLMHAVYLEKVNGYVSKGTPAVAPTIVQLSPPEGPTLAAITDCADGTNWKRYKIGSDAPFADSGSSKRHHVDATVQRIDGVWKVTKFELQTAGTC